jgi:hypothetical protein
MPQTSGYKLLLMVFTVSLLGCLFTSRSAFADTFTLSNSNGGDGSVVLPPSSTGNQFDLFGADNDVGANTTFYTAVAMSAETLSFNWNYLTFDCCGSHWDPAGYVVNGAQTQLSTDSFTQGLGSSGSFVLTLNTGDTYGFYVSSLDSVLGRGEIQVSAAPSPIPGAGFLSYITLGLLGLGSLGWKRLRQGPAEGGSRKPAEVVRGGLRYGMASYLSRLRRQRFQPAVPSPTNPRAA